MIAKDIADGQSTLNPAALTVAAAGGRNVLMIGPPGSGKTVHKGLFPAQRGYRAAS